jgi:hypothetical protein
VLPQQGHLWGHRELAIPISAVTSLGDERPRLNLTKDELSDLPPVDTDASS